MSLVSIANKLGTVKDITGKDASTVGATIYVRPKLTFDEKHEIRKAIDPQKFGKSNLEDKSIIYL